MTGIEAVKAREILDLPGNPAVEVNVQLSEGAKAAAANLGIKSGWAYRRDGMAKHSQLPRIEEEWLQRYS